MQSYNLLLKCARAELALCPPSHSFPSSHQSTTLLVNQCLQDLHLPLQHDHEIKFFWVGTGMLKEQLVAGPLGSDPEPGLG